MSNERSLWWKKTNDELDLLTLIDPLSPTQVFFLRIQARDALEAAFSLPNKIRPDQKCSEEESIRLLDWEKISAEVNQKCPDSKPQSGEIYRNVWMRIWLTEEGTVFIHDEKLVYEILPKMVPDPWFKFYNLGYKGDIDLQLEEKDSWWRHSIGLYHHLASQVEMQNKDVLEIGCGRGGGANYVYNRFQPNKYLGIDVSKGNVEFDRQNFQRENLKFERGDAVHLDFIEDSSFDIILNVESSHSYTSMHQFLDQVKRILRPGGFLVFTDSRHSNEIDVLRKELVSNDLKLIREYDISSNVANSLYDFERDIFKMIDYYDAKGDRRNAYVQLLTDLCKRWFPHFSSKKYTYISAVLQK